MKAVMKSEISRWVNSLTPLELAIYGIDKEQVNYWLDEMNRHKRPINKDVLKASNLITELRRKTK